LARNKDNAIELSRTDLNLAIEDLNRAIELCQADPRIYLVRAIIYFYLEDFDRSIVDFTKIIEVAPSSDAYYNRAVMLWETNEDRAALDDFDRAIDLKPNFVAAYYWRGNIYAQLGDETRSSADYEIAQSIEIETPLDREDEHGFYARGVARARLGDRVGAMVDLHTAEDFCNRYKNHITIRRIRAAIVEWNLV
jgi:tetratricopeptide (TPR) repeat protein